MLDILDLEFDEANESKLAKHGITVREAIQVLDDKFKAFRNRKSRAGEYLLVGRTHGGRLLTMPIVSTSVEGRWRPVTGWDSSNAEKTRYENQ